MLIALTSSSEHRRKHVLRLLRLCGDQALQSPCAAKDTPSTPVHPLNVVDIATVSE